ncbi:MAG: GntR family transcriptional regulator [Kiritimatiellae bacterium]|jgi:DNA-binding LacI/PurR family transcriptional regulator|nr:GntR family transcriptional regulator [Kiritimatiellia bacterium]
MSKHIKHTQIFSDLKKLIIEGKYADDGRLPSEAQLVLKYKVSRPTAARALHDLQVAGLVDRRAGSGTFARSISASDADQKKGGDFIGLLVPGMGVTEIFDVICGKLVRLARGNNYSVVWSSSPATHDPDGPTMEQAEEFCQELIESKVKGAFFAPFGWQNGQAKINRMIAGRLRVAGIPVVLLDCDVLPFPQRSDFDVVGIDNFKAAYMLTEHLLKMGCRKLQFVASTNNAPTVAARYAGFREVLLQYDVPVEFGSCPATDPSDEKEIGALLKNKPDAFVCANDYKAGVLMHTLENLGCNVPGDVRIVGFDDVKYATLLRVPLTTMHQPCHDIAYAAWQVMQNRIANPSLPYSTLSLNAHLVIRQSCGAYHRK